VSVFAYCYGRILHTIRRQSKVVGGQAGRGQNIAMATTSHDQNAGQAQQQTTGAAAGAKLSHTELTVLKTMITVIVLFVIFWCVPAITGVFILTRGVSPVIAPQICTVFYLDTAYRLLGYCRSLLQQWNLPFKTRAGLTIRGAYQRKAGPFSHTP